MSAPAAGKFQDHYDVLGLNHQADSSALRLAFDKLSETYDPLNEKTGNTEKFEAVQLAFEVLSDPELRKEFDKLKGIGADEIPKFSGPKFFSSYVRDTDLRAALLCLLYDRRRNKPYTPSLSMRHLEAMLLVTNEELTLALWYLKQKELVTQDDKSSLQITVRGMDYLEQHRPSPESVLPLIKPSSLAAMPAVAPEVAAVRAAGLDPAMGMPPLELGVARTGEAQVAAAHRGEVSAGVAVGSLAALADATGPAGSATPDPGPGGKRPFQESQVTRSALAAIKGKLGLQDAKSPAPAV